VSIAKVSDRPVIGNANSAAARRVEGVDPAGDRNRFTVTLRVRGRTVSRHQVPRGHPSDSRSANAMAYTTSSSDLHHVLYDPVRPASPAWRVAAVLAAPIHIQNMFTIGKYFGHEYANWSDGESARRRTTTASRDWCSADFFRSEPRPPQIEIRRSLSTGGIHSIDSRRSALHREEKGRRQQPAKKSCGLPALSGIKPWTPASLSLYTTLNAPSQSCV